MLCFDVLNASTNTLYGCASGAESGAGAGTEIGAGAGTEIGAGVGAVVLDH